MKRKLVLLKWDCVIEENGDEKWVFESTDPSIVKYILIGGG